MSTAICQKCKEEFHVEPWMEATDYCNECVHDVLDELKAQNAALKAEIESIGDEHRWTRSKTLAENVRELAVNKEALRVELLEALHKNEALRECANLLQSWAEITPGWVGLGQSSKEALANALEKGAM